MPQFRRLAPAPHLDSSLLFYWVWKVPLRVLLWIPCELVNESVIGKLSPLCTVTLWNTRVNWIVPLFCPGVAPVTGTVEKPCILPLLTL